VPFLRDLRVTLEMIKWEHSIFALPFALCGAMLAAGGLPTAHQVAWIIVAMVAARSAAMAFNRLADASIDAANPRTSARALPAGQLTPAFVATFVVISSVVFIAAAAELNRLALWLSPVALAVLLLYSYTKRFTRWSHLMLGFALGIAPSAAWIAVRGSLDPRILLRQSRSGLRASTFSTRARISISTAPADCTRFRAIWAFPARSGWRARSTSPCYFCWPLFWSSLAWASWRLQEWRSSLFCWRTNILWLQREICGSSTPPSSP
jgi:hypothetical protein